MSAMYSSDVLNHAEYLVYLANWKPIKNWDKPDRIYTSEHHAVTSFQLARKFKTRATTFTQAAKWKERRVDGDGILVHLYYSCVY